MRVLFINEVCGTGSHGRICVDLAKEFESAGDEVKIAYGRDFNVPEEAKRFAVPIGNKLNVYWHALYTRLTDKHGLASKRATKRFLKWAEKFNPDLLWLHNIHGYFINYEMLFAWIKSRPDMKVRWTLHDCWAFTGHCNDLAASPCERWKTGCYNCSGLSQYPKSYVDRSRRNFIDKKQAFIGVKELSIITPSQWLADLVKESFLQRYEVKVINNKIDTEVFKPSSSNFRKRYNLEEKKIILGVASVWNEGKGLYDFYKIADTLAGDAQVVIVGLDKKQKKNLPRNIIGIERTHNKKELAEIYTAADVFVNPSRGENYPTTNLEAQACGTPCVTYDTGGSKETISNGKTVRVRDFLGLINAIKEYIGD